MNQTDGRSRMNKGGGARTAASLDALARDVRHGGRRLLRDLGFTTAVVLILGLAIGTNTAIFSLVNAVLFRTSAVVHPDRLVNIYQNDPSGRPLVVASYSAYTELAQYTDIFAATMAGSIPAPARYLHGGAVRNATVEFATSTYLDVLGLRPSLGRWFSATEERPGAPPVAVLGREVWSRVFGADPMVIGQVLRIEGVPVTIVGVGPADYRGTVDIGLGTDLWLPVTAFPAIQHSAPGADSSIHAPLLVKARLRERVTVAQAGAAMTVLGRRLAAEHPEDYRRSGEFALGPGMTVLASTDVRIHPQADAAVMALAALALVMVGLVLAIACSNLATLLLVRGASRARELGVRLAMGASRLQLVRHLLVESVLLSLAGGVAGLLLTGWGGRALQRLDLPITVALAIDYRVFAFAMAVSLATGIASGLAPALHGTRVDVVSALRYQGLPSLDRRRLTLKSALILVQVAISVLLLAATAAFLQAGAAARGYRVRYAVDGVAILQTDLRFAGYARSEARTVYDELLRRIDAAPGVESAALIRGLPMDPTGVAIIVDDAAGQEEAATDAARIEAGPGFFSTLRIPLLYGRVFDARDRAETPRVAVITDRMARQCFRTLNAVGRRFRLAGDPDSWTEVIGVVRDPGTGNFDDDVLDPIAPPFFTSYTQSVALPNTVVARSSGDAATLLGTMTRELRAIDATLPVITAQTMARKLEASTAVPNAVAALLAALGAIGLLLAGIGLYAVVSFAVTRRTHEIGIRIALGARSQQVVWSIVRSVAGLVGVGVGIGLTLSILAMLALRTSSGNIGIGNIAALAYHPTIDPVALLVIAALTAVVGFAAAWGPGRRAARLDPLAALRHA